MRGDGSADSPANGLTQAQEDERRAAALWRANMAAAEAAAKGGDGVGAMTFSKVAADCYKQLQSARRAREADDVRRGATLPAAEFENFRHALQAVAALVRGLDRELASRVNPENPHYARSQISIWLRERWNPAIEELIERTTHYNPEMAAA